MEKNSKMKKISQINSNYSKIGIYSIPKKIMFIQGRKKYLGKFFFKIKGHTNSLGPIFIGTFGTLC